MKSISMTSHHHELKDHHSEGSNKEEEGVKVNEGKEVKEESTSIYTNNLN